MLEVLKVELPKVVTKEADILKNDVSKITPEQILIATSKYYNVLINNVRGKSRNGELVKTRKVYCYLACMLTGESLAKIGWEICKDHATVLHHKKEMTNWMNISAYNLQREVDAIKEGLRL